MNEVTTTIANFDIDTNDIVPYNGLQPVYFADDFWDFNDGTRRTDAAKSTVDFTTCAENYRTLAKQYCCHLVLIGKTKARSFCLFTKIAIQFFNFLEDNAVHNIEDVTLDILKQYLEDEKAKNDKNYREKMRKIIREILSMYAGDDLDLFSHDIMNYLAPDSKNTRSLSTKTALLPREWVHQFISICIKIMDNEEEPLIIRALAGLYIIECETGLRCGELLHLRVSDLKKEYVYRHPSDTSFDLVYNYILFDAWKQAQGTGNVKVEVHMSDLAVKAFKTLEKIYAPYRTEDKDFLYYGPVDGPRFNIKNVPYTPGSSLNHRRVFFDYIDKYTPTVNVTLPNIQNTQIEAHTISYHSEEHSLAMPSMTQFRVYFATELYRKGVTLDYIEKYMGHISDVMRGYYIAQEEAKKRSHMIALDMVRSVASGDATLYGGQDPQGLTEKLRTIDPSLLSITREEELGNYVKKNYAIAPKSYGYCIKAGKDRRCGDDSEDKLLCALGYCPNIHYVYYNANVCLQEIRNLLHSIDINKKNRQRCAVTQCIGSLNNILDTAFIPMLTEIRKHIINEGKDIVIKKHPKLKEIVDTIDTLEIEVQEWKQITA